MHHFPITSLRVLEHDYPTIKCFKNFCYGIYLTYSYGEWFLTVGKQWDSEIVL